jgi:hypothetical protein
MRLGKAPLLTRIKERSDSEVGASGFGLGISALVLPPLEAASAPRSFRMMLQQWRNEDCAGLRVTSIEIGG